jgi:hypothetical protein
MKENFSLILPHLQISIESESTSPDLKRKGREGRPDHYLDNRFRKARMTRVLTWPEKPRDEWEIISIRLNTSREHDSFCSIIGNHEFPAMEWCSIVAGQPVSRTTKTRVTGYPRVDNHTPRFREEGSDQ